MLKNTLELDDDKSMVMLTFNDITVLSFQNIQLKEYDRVIGKMTDEEYKSDSNPDEPDIINKTSFETE